MLRTLTRLPIVSLWLFAAILCTSFAVASRASAATAMACDVDGDADIDRNDIVLITAARGKPASGPTDPRDPDRDGMITVNDARACTLRCTLPQCAIPPGGNRPPVANAGPDVVAFVGDRVTLDGSASSDPDGNPLTYRWTLRVRPAGSAAVLSDATVVMPSFLVDVAGRYEIDLVVNDGFVNSAVDSVVVTTPPANTNPVANAGLDQAAVTGQRVDLDGSASSDIDGDPLTFAWAFVSRPTGSSASLSSADTVTPNFVPDLPGTYTIRLTVNDGRGGSGTDTVGVVTTQANRPPVANAGPDQSVIVSQIVMLDGTASSDPDSNPLTYRWTLLTRPAGSTAALSGATTATPQFTADRAGDFVAQLIVNDGFVDSAADTVVISTSNTRPVANAGPDQTVTQGATVNLDGTGSSDANGDPLTFFWSLTTTPAGSSATLNGADTATPSFVADLSGLFIAQLVVNDGALDSLPDTTTVTVDAQVNRDPVAANDTASMDEDGAPILIAVLANDSDPDGDPLTITSVGTPANGAAVIVGNQVRFTPNADFHGTNTFSYAISDGRGGSASAFITVTVRPINDDPVANDDTASTSAGTPVDVDVLANDTDVDGDTLTISAVGAAANGTAVIVGGAVQYVPNAGFSGTDTFSYTVSDGNGGSDTATVTVSVGALPMLSIADVTVTEGNAANLTVSLSAPSGQTVTVQYATSDGGATAGADYTAASNTITFAPGVTTQTIAIATLDDTLDELAETFSVTLSAPGGATIGDGTAVVTIADNDPAPSLSIDDVTVAEGNAGTSSATFAVSLSAVSGQQVTVNFATSNGTASAGSDYVANAGTLTIPAGQASGTLSVVVNGDTLFEASENFNVTLSAPANATLADGAGLGTITNDDTAPTLGIVDVSLAEGNSGTTSFVFTVTQSAISGLTTTVDFTTADGLATSPADYGAVSGSATIPAGATTGTITVAVSGDSTVEPDETFLVNLSNAVNATIADGQATGTILNDDGAVVINLGDATVTEGGTATLTATLTSASSQTITVQFATSNGTATAGTDYTADSGTLTFTPGVTTQSINVVTTADALDEPDETVNVTLSSATNATIGDGTGIVTITDDDPTPTLSIGDVALPEGNSGTSTASFIVALSAVSGQQVTVDFATSDGTATAGSDYTAASGTATIPAGQGSVAVAVTVLGDTVVEPNETFVVNLSNATHSTIADLQATGTIQNDDALPVITVAATDATATEAGPTTGTFTFTRTGDTTFVLVVQVDLTGTAVNGVDYSVINIPVSFAPGSATATATVMPVNDPTVEGGETVIATIVDGADYDVGAPNSATVTIADDDGGLGLVPANQTLFTISTGSLTVTLPSPAGAGGQLVNLVSGNTTIATVPASVTVLEGATAATVTVTTATTTGSVQITASASGFTDATATVTVAERTMTVAPASPVVGVGRSIGGTVTLAAPAPSGGVTVTLASGNSGLATVAPTSLTFNEGETTATFTINGIAVGTTSINATAPGFAPASASITVSAQLINIGVVPVVGPGQSASLPISLSTPAVGDVVVNLTMANTAIATVTSPVIIPNGAFVPPNNPQITGVALGTTTVTAAASGFAPETRAVTVALSLSFATAPNPLQVTVGQTESIALTLSAPAAAGGLTVNLSSDATAIATVPATVFIPFGQTQVQVPVTGVALGATTIRANAAGIAEATKSVQVIDLGDVLFNLASVAVGDELQQSGSVRLESAPPAPVDITLSVPAGSGVLLSQNPTVAGSETLTIPNVGDAANRTFYVQGTALGATTVTASATGYASDTLPVTVTPSGFAFYGVSDPVQVDAFAPNQTYQVWSVRLNPDSTFSGAWQPLRGGATASVPVTSSNTVAGTITNSPLNFIGNTSSINAVFDPIAQGSTTVSLAQPAGFTATATATGNARTTFTVNLVGSAVLFAQASVAVGDELQQSGSVRLESAPPAPVDITLSVPAGSGVLLSASPTAAGSETLTFTSVNDASNRTFYVQGTALGATTVTAQASGYVDDTLPVTVTPSGFAFYGVGNSADINGVATNFQVYSVRLNPDTSFSGAWQPLRGGATASVPVASSNTAVGTITNSPLSFVGNTSLLSATFDPASQGTATVSITQPPGFTATTTASTSARTAFTANVINALPIISITSADPSAAEAGQGVATFTITRNGGNQAVALSVQLNTAGSTATYPTDFTASPAASVPGAGILQWSIPANQGSLTVTLTPVRDNLVEAQESFGLAVNPLATYDIGSPASVNLTIDDDPPVITLTATDGSALEAGQQTGTFVLARSGGNVAVALNVRVTLASSTATSITDYSLVPNPGNLGGDIRQFSIPAAQSSLTVTLTPALDNLVEGTEAAVFAIDPSTNASYTIGSPAAGTINISDDPPVITLTPTDSTATEAGPTTGSFTMGRSGGNLAASLPVRISLAGSTATVVSDYNTSPAFGNLGGDIRQFTFAASSASQLVTVTPINDSAVEPVENAVFTLDPSTASPGSYTIGSPNTATVAITSDE